MPGQTPSPGTQFKPGVPTNPNGRGWLPDSQLQAIRDVCSHVVNQAVDLIGDKAAPANARVEAMELVLNYAFGTPQIAMLVRYEVDLIIERLGLPPRGSLFGKDGNRVFSPVGGYKPSFNIRSSLERNRILDKIRVQESGEAPESYVKTYEGPPPQQ
jgi:hypothetical protein